MKLPQRHRPSTYPDFAAGSRADAATGSSSLAAGGPCTTCRGVSPNHSTRWQGGCSCQRRQACSAGCCCSSSGGSRATKSADQVELQADCTDPDAACVCGGGRTAAASGRHAEGQRRAACRWVNTVLCCWRVLLQAATRCCTSLPSFLAVHVCRNLLKLKPALQTDLASRQPQLCSRNVSQQASTLRLLGAVAPLLF